MHRYHDQLSTAAENYKRMNCAPQASAPSVTCPATHLIGEGGVWWEYPAAMPRLIHVAQRPDSSGRLRTSDISKSEPHRLSLPKTPLAVPPWQARTCDSTMQQLPAQEKSAEAALKLGRHISRNPRLRAGSLPHGPPIQRRRLRPKPHHGRHQVLLERPVEASALQKKKS